MSPAIRKFIMRTTRMESRARVDRPVNRTGVDFVYGTALKNHTFGHMSQ
jgi:hypothetical protein